MFNVYENTLHIVGASYYIMYVQFVKFLYFKIKYVICIYLQVAEGKLIMKKRN